MAKNWKKLIPAEPTPTLESNLRESLQELLQLDDTLKSLLQEREDLEQQLKSLGGISTTQNEPTSKTFDQPIESFQAKRKEDKKYFESKKRLEGKIAAKKNAYKHWEKQRDKVKAKVAKSAKPIDKAKAFENDFLYDDFEEKWLKKREAFKQKVKKKPKDHWSGDREKRKTNVTQSIKDYTLKKVTKKIEQNPKVKKAKDIWETVRDKKRDALKLKARGENKWDAIQKKSMVDSFNVLPAEAKNELRQFENDFKRSRQKKKDDFEEKQQKLKDRVIAKKKQGADNTEKKEQQRSKVAKHKGEEEKREEKRQQRQDRVSEKRLQERKREEKREQRREDRKKRKKGIYD